MTHRPPTTGLGLRSRVERVSDGPMFWLRGRRPLVFVLFLALLIATVAVPGLLALLPGLLLVAALGWFSYHSWPMIPPQGRVVRAVVLVVLLVLVVTHALR